MPKLTIDRVRPLISQIRAGNFIGLGAGAIDRRANGFYRKALENKFAGQERLDAYEFYKLSLQLQRSADPLARLALAGFELEKSGDGWVYGRAFEREPLARNDYEKRENDRDPNSELIARGQDWTIEITAGKDKLLTELDKLASVLEGFPGATLAIPETVADSNVIRIYANHDTVNELSAKLTDRSIDHQAIKYCLDKDGQYIWQMERKDGKIQFGDSPYLRGVGSNLVNVERGKTFDADWAILTDVGTFQVREKNEDSAGHVLLDGKRELFIVADGMGGHAKGDLASKIAVETMISAMKNGRSLVEAVKDTSQEVMKNGQSGGSTLVALLIDREAEIGQIAWVGDSRARFVTEDAEGLLTRDHSRLFNLVRMQLRDEGRDIELPITKDRMEEIEATLDAMQAAGTSNIRSHGNVIDAALGHGAQPTIGLVEFPLGKGEKPAKLALYSDGLVDGPAKEIESEIAITEIMRRDQPAEKAVDDLLAQAYSAGTSDNVTVALVNLPEGLNLAEMKVISGERFQQELIARLSDVNNQMTMGELKYMVEVYLLNPSIVPAELIERTKQKAVASRNAEAVVLLRMIDPSIPPVPAVEMPPPLPAVPAGRPSSPTSEISDSQIISDRPITKLITAGPLDGTDKWAVTVKFDSLLGEMSQATALAIGSLFRPRAKTKFFSVSLSNNLQVKALADPANLKYFLDLVRIAIEERSWWRKKDSFYIQYLGREAKSGQPKFMVYREDEVQPEFIQQNFAQ